MRLRLTIRCAALVILMLALSVPTLAARPQEPLPPSAAEFVRRAIANENKASHSDGRYLFRLRREKPDGSDTREMVETRDMIVARYIAVNDKPLTAEQRRKDDERLVRLANSPDDQRQKRHDQQQDEERVRRMVSALPDAFLYEYAGRVVLPSGEAVKLTFKPNPDFSSDVRETLIFRSMEGVMLIDLAETRLVRIEAVMVDDVSVGWGILGRLDRGGRFELEQSKIGTNLWKRTKMVLDFNGRALLFKHIRVKQIQTASDFSKVPDLSVKEGVELLMNPQRNLSAKR